MRKLLQSAADNRPPTPPIIANQPVHLLINSTQSDLVYISPVTRALTEYGYSLHFPPFLVDHTGTLATKSTCVTFWSPTSVFDEDVVFTSAQYQKMANLLSVRIADIDPPIGFRQEQFVDLVTIDEHSASTIHSSLNSRQLPHREASRNHSLYNFLYIVVDSVFFVFLFNIIFYSIILFLFSNLINTSVVSLVLVLYLVSQSMVSCLYVVFYGSPPLIRHPLSPLNINECVTLDMLLCLPLPVLLFVLITVGTLTGPLLAVSFEYFLFYSFSFLSALISVLFRWTVADARQAILKVERHG